MDLPVHGREGGSHIHGFNEDAWQRRCIVTARHCVGCTAGAGSSCGGQTA